eukprot:m.256031 g.256031  ORF g.256031 m.256031 type:complete len:659 (-) comp34021_c0_seq1:535-2511(-)
MSPITMMTTLPNVAPQTKVGLEIGGKRKAEALIESPFAHLGEVADRFITQAIKLCNPDAVHVCNGSVEENQSLLDLLVENGTILKLDQTKRPGCYAARSDPKDVARSMGDTYICSNLKKDAGPTNNWMEPSEMRLIMSDSFQGCMEGRIMYVVPFCMGPYDSPVAKYCIQITDSPYVVVNLRITTRMGAIAMNRIAGGQRYIECWHSVGCPISESDVVGSDQYLKARSSWPCDISKRKIVHFPDSQQVMSFGSGYGGNALLGKKCVALRIASSAGFKEGWLAEHMLILGITNPDGVKRYICAAFPSACGKTNLAMLAPSLPGWKVETIGDDIAWLWVDDKGKMRAVNPEAGFFGVAPGTSMTSNPNACKTFATNSLFTNVGVTDGGDIYWEGMDNLPEDGITDWLGNANWKPTVKANGKIDAKTNPAAHPNSRFTTPLSQCPIVDPSFDDPEGVPIEAIIFGGRRDDTQPLVYQSYDWNHGTFVGASMRSNATKAADQKGLVNDPMAMLPFIGYNIKDYFAHWISMGSKVSGDLMPKVFHVNWFGKDSESNFLWPGFSENVRVLDWILKRCDGAADAGATETPIGFVPTPASMNLEGIQGLDESALKTLLEVDTDLWKAEAKQIRKYFTESLMNNDTSAMPPALMQQLTNLENRLEAE